MVWLWKAWFYFDIAAAAVLPPTWTLHVTGVTKVINAQRLKNELNYSKHFSRICFSYQCHSLITVHCKTLPFFFPPSLGKPGWENLFVTILLKMPGNLSVKYLSGHINFPVPRECILLVVTFPSRSLSLPDQRCQKTPQRVELCWDVLGSSCCVLAGGEPAAPGPGAEGAEGEPAGHTARGSSGGWLQNPGSGWCGGQSWASLGLAGPSVREIQTLFAGGFSNPQAKAVLKFIEAISEKTLRSTVALTAARGRGKSAALGLAIAGAVAFGWVIPPLQSPRLYLHPWVKKKKTTKTRWQDLNIFVISSLRSLIFLVLCLLVAPYTVGQVFLKTQNNHTKIEISF